MIIWVNTQNKEILLINLKITFNSLNSDKRLKILHINIAYFQHNIKIYHVKKSKHSF